MRYENRQAPEGINVTKVNPLVQFLKFFIASIIVVVLIVVILQVAGGAVAKRIPFKYELQLMDTVDPQLGTSGASEEMVAYLNDLAIRVGRELPIDEGISVKVHYSTEEVFNAFATIGGNLLFYRGLLSEMPHENALAMVMAHEIAHVNHRDPVASLGGGVASLIAMSMFTGMSGLAGDFFNKTYSFTGMQFTRRMEETADEAALGAVNALYGHVNGAGVLFEVMGEIKGDSEAIPDWLERFAVTHPLSNDRVSAVRILAAKNGWSSEGETTPLPADFLLWLNSN